MMRGIILIALLVCAQCTETTIINKLLLAEMQTRTNDVIDDGLALLEELLQAAERELAEAVGTHSQSEQGLEQQVDNLDQSVLDLQGECMDHDDTLALMRSEFERHREVILWLQGRIEADRSRIATLKELRCSSNSEWLNFIRSSNMTLKLIQFLRTALENYNSFAEIHSMHKALDRMRDEVEMNMQEVLAQLRVEAKQEEEVEDDNSILTNWQSTTQSRDINAVKQQLIEILNRMEKSILSKISTSQSNEIITNLRVHDFIEQLEKEVEFLLQSLASVSDVLGSHPQETIAAQEQTVEQCRRRLDQMTGQVSSQHSAVENVHVQDSELEGRLQRQRDLIVEIMRQYQQGLLTVANHYRLRVDDYADNSEFDSEASTQFTNRALDSNYREKAQDFNQYVEDVVRGQVQPVTVEVDPTDTVTQAAHVEDGSEETAPVAEAPQESAQQHAVEAELETDHNLVEPDQPAEEAEVTDAPVAQETTEEAPAPAAEEQHTAPLDDSIWEQN